VLDESTSAMNAETERLIQDLIDSVFKNCTVISIAHRLSTIVGFDRVIVLDKGEISEIDTPLKLLSDSNSAFYQLAKASGEFNLLVDLAKA
jgi:ABC-type multidrug transport system fused ATPase/permease subunit